MRAIQLVVVCVAVLVAGQVQAAIITNFSAVYDPGLSLLSYSFDLISVDGVSPSGVN